MKFSFTKMHGTGNDYVYVDLFQQKLENQAEVAKVVSDRHRCRWSDLHRSVGDGGLPDDHV